MSISAIRSILVGTVWVAAVGIPYAFENRNGFFCIALLLGAAVLSVLAIRSKAGRAWFLSLATVLVTLLAIEGYFVMTAPQDARFAGDFEGVYYIDHTELGYGPRPGGRYRANKWVGNVSVYDVTYSINEAGLRIVPSQPDRAPRTAAFFGGSITFGEGLEDEQSMPNQFAAQAGGRYRVYNFGFHGYGPHQMLRALETDFVEIAVGPRLDLVVYQGIETHIARSTGQASWDLSGPKYTVNGQGFATHDGSFHGPVYRWVSRFFKDWALFRVIERKTLVSGRVFDQDFDTYVSILKSARKLANERFGAEFLVLFWDKGSGAQYVQRILDGLADANFRVIRISEIIPDIASGNSRYVLSANDPHPSAVVNRLIGSYLAKTVAD